jgi:hypothetical protein
LQPFSNKIFIVMLISFLQSSNFGKNARREGQCGITSPIHALECTLLNYKRLEKLILEGTECLLEQTTTTTTNRQPFDSLAEYTSMAWLSNNYLDAIDCIVSHNQDAGKLFPESLATSFDIP